MCTNEEVAIEYWEAMCARMERLKGLVKDGKVKKG